MSVSFQYAYLLGDFFFLLLWLFLFVARKNARRDMLILGSFFGLIMLVTQYYWWTVDWWRPETIFGTRVGFEDLLLGFTSTGVVTAIYDISYVWRPFVRTSVLSGVAVIPVLFITAALFWVVGLTSFWAVITAMLLGILFIYPFERISIMTGVACGTFFTLATFCFYYPILLLSPGWVDATYDFQNLSGVILAGIPIEEFVFWILFGIIFGPFYAYWRRAGVSQKGFAHRDGIQ